MSGDLVKGVLVCGALLAVALLVSACGGGALSDAEQQSLAATAAAPAKLQPGDKVNIVVFGESSLSGDYQLNQSGQISLPLAGTIEAQGLTQSELEQALAKKFRSEYLRNPKVILAHHKVANRLRPTSTMSAGQLRKGRIGPNITVARLSRSRFHSGRGMGLGHIVNIQMI